MEKPSDCHELLKEMVAIESINEQLSHRSNPEAALMAYLEDMCGALGLPARRLQVDKAGSANLLVQWKVDEDADWLLFESHMDTVGVEGMTVAPFDGVIEDGRMYGRGTCDTKSSGAAMLWALDRYARSGEKRNNIAVLFVVDEESLKRGVKAFVSEQLDTLKIQPVGAIVGEPTSLEPVVAHCGVARWSIQTHGVAAHSSNPSNGRSAIRMMVDVIEALESGYIDRLTASHPLTGPAHCSINMIRGGTAVNIVPDECRIWIDRRVVPGEDPADVIPEVEKVLEPLDISYSIVDQRTDPPLNPAGSEAFIASVCDTLKSMNRSGEPAGAGFGSDGSTFSNAGVPAVLVGPGDIAQAHSEDEYIDLVEVDEAIEVYYALMCSDLGGCS